MDLAKLAHMRSYFGSLHILISARLHERYMVGEFERFFSCSFNMVMSFRGAEVCEWITKGI